MKPLVKHARSFPVSIFIAGSHIEAQNICKKYCDDTGYCVTVTPTEYVYTSGQEAGIIVGLINYPRFPAEPEQILNRAVELAIILKEQLGQQSFSIQTPNDIIWYSYRKEDVSDE